MKKLLAGGVAAILAVGVAYSQVTVPQVATIGANDLFQDVVNGIPQSQSYYAAAPLLGNYAATQAGNNPENFFIGGDAGTNLVQPGGTTGSTVTTTPTYGGPDRWFYWSGTGTNMTVGQSTTAGDLPTSFKAAFKMARASGQTGVIQVCMGQVIENNNAITLAGQPVEMDFHVVAGSNFSGTAVQAYIVTGTTANESSAKMAYTVSSLGPSGGTVGTSPGWAGQALTVNQNITWGASGSGRITVAGIIPAASVEVGGAICFTPVGTAGTNDYLAISGIQLTRNSALSTVANVTGGVQLGLNDPRAKSFNRRPQALESLLQYRYYYTITEGAAIQSRAMCTMTTSGTAAACLVQFPTAMRISPIGTFAVGFALPTTTSQTALNNCTGIAAQVTLSTMVASNLNEMVACTNSSGTTAALGISLPLFDNNGTGSMKFNAEL